MSSRTWWAIILECGHFWCYIWTFKLLSGTSFTSTCSWFNRESFAESNQWFLWALHIRGSQNRPARQQKQKSKIDIDSSNLDPDWNSHESKARAKNDRGANTPFAKMRIPGEKETDEKGKMHWSNVEEHTQHAKSKQGEPAGRQWEHV
jgi:hypothetical protein